MTCFEFLRALKYVKLLSIKIKNPIPEVLFFNIYKLDMVSFIELFSTQQSKGVIMKKIALFFLLVFLGTSFLAEAQSGSKPLRLALSSVFPGKRQDIVNQWQHYLEARLHRPVVFVQRRTYRELTDLFSIGQLDAGWVCGAPYLLHKPVQRLLAVGQWHGKPMYQSYLIVRKNDTVTHSILDLRGKNFAYSDPESNSGFFVPQTELITLGFDPDRFFGKTVFTYDHSKSIEAVSSEYVDGARVDGYVYERLLLAKPEIANQTRIVSKSVDYGFPPIVTRADLPQHDFKLLQETLLGMSSNKEGKALLAEMGLDGFVAGSDHLFDGISSLLRIFSDKNK